MLRLSVNVESCYRRLNGDPRPLSLLKHRAYHRTDVGSKGPASKRPRRTGVRLVDTVPVRTEQKSPLDGPPINPAFEAALDELVTTAEVGHDASSPWFNPPDSWLVAQIRLFHELPDSERLQVLAEASELEDAAARANADGRAAERVWPRAGLRLDNGGLAFFSQLGVARRPDITQYFIDGFQKNRHSAVVDEQDQELLAEVLPYVTEYMDRHFASGDGIIQTDRQIGDAPGRSFHARQLLFGADYPQVPYMWRQLTFDLPSAQRRESPEILEVSVPHWLEDLGLPERLKGRIGAAGLDKLVFKAPTKGLSLHLGFDYVGEHKMGPLSIAMFKVKEAGGIAVQAALSMARAKDLKGSMKNTAIVTVGPSLHGKSTLTIMIELAGSDLAALLDLTPDPEEGVYPMNDDIVMLQRLSPSDNASNGHAGSRYSIDGTENSFYAVPFGLSRESDPITYDVVRGTEDSPNAQETLENVPVDPVTGAPDYDHNPVRNMRMIVSRSRLLERKGAQDLLGKITGGELTDSVHVPLEHTDRVFWQAVMRQNTVMPPLRRVSLDQYIRVLMYGEAVQMGAASGAIGRPYTEYFSDPFIIGLEDDNATQMYRVLRDMERAGQAQDFFVFNTGGIGADTNEEAAGPTYKKIPRELTLMLQEALLREAVVFEHDEVLGSDVGVAIVDRSGEVALDLRDEWLPKDIFGQAEYSRRVVELNRSRCYGSDSADKSGILQYTRVDNDVMDVSQVPTPRTERELAWLLSFYWNMDQASDSLAEVGGLLTQAHRPAATVLEKLRNKCRDSVSHHLDLTPGETALLRGLGVY